MKITKNQIKQLDNGETTVRDLFPKVFEPILNVGKWYKDKSDYYKGLLLVLEYNGDKKGVTGCGFGWNTGEFKEIHSEWVTSKESKEDLIEATEKEVREYLTNEAVKRGFISGCYHTITNGSPNEIKKPCSKEEARYGFYAPDNKLLLNNWSIFENGKWAEVIPTITKEEAEKLLNKKIV